MRSVDDYDAIVIGSGIGGLVSAGILASKGLKTLVLEKHSSAGGYLSSFSRQGFTFDSAVDCISGVAPGGLIFRVLALLGVADSVRFLRVDPIRVSMFPDFNVSVGADLYEYRERLCGLFPAEAYFIGAFLDKIRVTYEQLGSALHAAFEGGSKLTIPPQEVLQLMQKSYGELLDEYFSDHRLKAVLSDRCPFIGLPPGNVSAAAMINLMMSYFDLGAFRPEGGIQKLSDAFVDGLKRCGSRVIFGSEAERILLDGADRCRAVRCSGGEYSARHVISNADFIHTLGVLVGGKYGRIANNMMTNPGISTSFFILYAGLNGKLDAHSSIGYYPSYDMSRFFDTSMEFSEDSTIGITIASKEDGTRAPYGCETVVFHEMTEASGRTIDKGACTEMILKKAGRIFPDLRNKMVMLDAATPSTLQRYTRNCGGAAFGWKQLPGFRGPMRHGIPNLYIAGHWGDFGGGALAAAYSGAKAACEILAAEGIRNAI